MATLMLGAPLAIGGCSPTVGGQPSSESSVSVSSGTGDPSSTSGAGTGSLASVDPCSLLTQQASQHLGVTDGPKLPKVKDAALARVCAWSTDKVQFQIGFDFVRRFDVIGGVDKMQRLNLGGLTGVLGDNVGGGHGCLARFDVGERQVVDGTSAANSTGAVDPCAVLKQVMELAIAQLPK